MAALQWGDRYPERAARDVVQVDIVEAGETAGVTAVLAADAVRRSGRVARPSCTASAPAGQVGSRSAIDALLSFRYSPILPSIASRRKSA